MAVLGNTTATKLTVLDLIDGGSLKIESTTALLLYGGSYRDILHAGTSYVSSGKGYISGNEITTITGNAGTATSAGALTNLTRSSALATWGTLTAANSYSNIGHWADSTGGGIAIGAKSSQISIQVDGFFYLNEGAYKVMDTSNASISGLTITINGNSTTWTNVNSSYLEKAGDTMTGLLVTKLGTNSGASLYGIKLANNSVLTGLSNDVLLLKNNALRFSDVDDWDYNKWAGLKYSSTNKIVYLGLADGTVFTANSAQSGGKLYLPGISSIYAGNGTTAVILEGDSRLSDARTANGGNSDTVDGLHGYNFPRPWRKDIYYRANLVQSATGTWATLCKIVIDTAHSYGSIQVRGNFYFESNNDSNCHIEKYPFSFYITNAQVISILTTYKCKNTYGSYIKIVKTSDYNFELQATVPSTWDEMTFCYSYSSNAYTSVTNYTSATSATSGTDTLWSTATILPEDYSNYAVTAGSADSATSAGSVTNALSWKNAALSALSYNGSAARSITSLALTENALALEFRPNHTSYHSTVEYATSGSEALMFVNKQAQTSFIFKCGATLTATSAWATAVPTPTLLMKYLSVVINKLIAEGVVPTYNLEVNGTTNLTSDTTVGGLLTASSLSVSGSASFTSTISGSINGNAATATLLLNSRNITIGNKTNAFNGGSNISFTLSDIGAAASSHGIHPSASTAGYAAYYSAASTVTGTSLLAFDTTNSIASLTPATVSMGGTGNAVLKIVGVSATTDYKHIYVTDGSAGTTRPLALQVGYGNVGIGTAAPSLKLEVSGGILAITNNGNTLSIGSQNSSWCHIYNSASINFIFNRAVCTQGDVYPYSTNTYNCGTSSNRWKNVYGVNVDTTTLNATGESTLTSATIGSLVVNGNTTFNSSVTANAAITATNLWDITTYSVTKTLSSSAWTDSGITLPTAVGSYMISLQASDSIGTGVFSILSTSDTAGDEIALHTQSTTSTPLHLYARTKSGKLELASSDSVTNKVITIKIKRIL